eukprot:TRINITY_DN3107_c0_g1_i1.p2 TRINITY_DN3107_c0_g1~~TRINITY_DN3107_c0_g1_i1.p2  ORF type:complete len:303 (-),score=67.62 TRINITY_DN3107_c0_g1_i1:120-1028(-)
MDFLQKILKKEPKNRITVNEALEHKFIQMNMPSENISSDAEDDVNAIQEFMKKNQSLENKTLQSKKLIVVKNQPAVKSRSNKLLNFGSSVMMDEPQSMILPRYSITNTKGFVPQSMQFSENFGSFIFAQHPAVQQLKSEYNPLTQKSIDDATPGFPKPGDTFITLNEKSFLNDKSFLQEKTPNNLNCIKNTKQHQQKQQQQQQQLNESQFRQSQFYSSQLREIEDEEEAISFDEDDDNQFNEESKIAYYIEKQKTYALNINTAQKLHNESTQNFTRFTGTAQQTSDHKFQANEELSSKRKFK